MDQASVKTRLENVWSDRKKVADILWDLLFLQYAHQVNLDYDDQIRYALEIGVIAGNSSSPEEVIERFIALVDVDEEDE